MRALIFRKIENKNVLLTRHGVPQEKSFACKFVQDGWEIDMWLESEKLALDLFPPVLENAIPISEHGQIPKCNSSVQTTFEGQHLVLTDTRMNKPHPTAHNRIPRHRPRHELFSIYQRKYLQPLPYSGIQHT